MFIVDLVDVCVVRLLKKLDGSQKAESRLSLELIFCDVRSYVLWSQRGLWQLL